MVGVLSIAQSPGDHLSSAECVLHINGRVYLVCFACGITEDLWGSAVRHTRSEKPTKTMRSQAEIVDVALFGIFAYL